MADTAQEKKRKKEKRQREAGNTIAYILASSPFALYKPPAQQAYALDDDTPVPSAAAALTAAGAGAGVVQVQNTVMELRGGGGQLLRLNPAVLDGPLPAQARLAKNDPNYELTMAGGKPIVAGDNDEEEYGLWKDSGYHAEHFKEGAELGDIEDALKNNAELRASWIEASKKVYEMHHGEAVPSDWSDEEVLEEGLDYIREFNNTLVAVDFGWGWTRFKMLIKTKS